MTTKKQHYVPQFYLNQFINNSTKRLHVYSLDSDSFFQTTPENICAENYLYEPGHIERIDVGAIPEDLKNCIEKRLADTESRISSCYRQLLECCNNKEFHSEVFTRSRYALCCFAAHLTARHPKIMTANRALAINYMEEIVDSNTLTPEERSYVDELAVDGNLSIVGDIAFMQVGLFPSVPEEPTYRMIDALSKKKMVVLEAPVGMGFITTSFPICFTNPDPDNYDFELAYMPLSNRFAALFSTERHVCDYQKLSIMETVEFNAELLTSGLWDCAIANANGPLNAAVNRWKKEMPGVRFD